MSRAVKFNYVGGDGSFIAIRCPACKVAHRFPYAFSESDRRYYDHEGFQHLYNGDAEHPTLDFAECSAIGTDYESCPLPDGHEVVATGIDCHFTVTDGRITFSEESTHDLAGQTVELPEFWPEDNQIQLAGHATIIADPAEPWVKLVYGFPGLSPVSAAL